MSVKKTVRGLLLFALVLVPLRVALAKEIGSVTVSGPGLPGGGVELTDPEIVEQITWDRLIAGLGSSGIEEPEVDVGYELAWHFIDENGNVMATQRVRYYPDPQGGRGYIFVVGMDEPGYWSEAGKWFYANQSGESALREVLAGYDVAFPDGESAGPAAAPPASQQVVQGKGPALDEQAAPDAGSSFLPSGSGPLLAVGTLGGLAVLLAAGYWWLRARSNRPAAEAARER